MKRSFENETVREVVESIAEKTINNRPFNIIHFHTALKMIENQCWDLGINVKFKYEEMSIGVIFNCPCGLIVKGFSYENGRKREFRILYEQSTCIMRFLPCLYKTQL